MANTGGRRRGTQPLDAEDWGAELTLTHHARARAHGRRLAGEDLAFALHYGRTTYRFGALVKFLGRRDIPPELEKSHGHLQGLTLVIKDGCVLTVYKNPEHWKTLKKAVKFYL